LGSAVASQADLTAVPGAAGGGGAELFFDNTPPNTTMPTTTSSTPTRAIWTIGLLLIAFLIWASPLGRQEARHS